VIHIFTKKTQNFDRPLIADTEENKKRRKLASSMPAITSNSDKAVRDKIVSSFVNALKMPSSVTGDYYFHITSFITIISLQSKMRSERYFPERIFIGDNCYGELQILLQVHLRLAKFSIEGRALQNNQ